MLRWGEEKEKSQRPKGGGKLSINLSSRRQALIRKKKRKSRRRLSAWKRERRLSGLNRFPTRNSTRCVCKTKEEKEEETRTRPERRQKEGEKSETPCAFLGWRALKEEGRTG